MAGQTIDAKTYPIWVASRIAALQECLAIARQTEKASLHGMPGALEIATKIEGLLTASEQDLGKAEFMKALTAEVDKNK